MQKEESKEKNRIYNDYSRVCSRKRKRKIHYICYISFTE